MTRAKLLVTICQIEWSRSLEYADDDFMVPHAHSRWLEKHISTAVLRFIPGQGHISIGIKYRDEVLKQAQDLLRQG